MTGTYSSDSDNYMPYGPYSMFCDHGLRCSPNSGSGFCIGRQGYCRLFFRVWYFWSNCRCTRRLLWTKLAFGLSHRCFCYWYRLFSGGLFAVLLYKRSLRSLLWCVNNHLPRLYYARLSQTRRSLT